MINDLIENGVSQEELDLAKGYLRGNMKINTEDNNHIVTYNGKQAVMFPTEPIIPYSELYDKKYKSIKKSDILDVIRTYFVVQGMTICMVGENLPKIDVVRKLCRIKK